VREGERKMQGPEPRVVRGIWANERRKNNASSWWHIMTLEWPAVSDMGTLTKGELLVAGITSRGRSYWLDMTEAQILITQRLSSVRKGVRCRHDMMSMCRQCVGSWLTGEMSPMIGAMSGGEDGQIKHFMTRLNKQDAVLQSV
jgi:hypothetical protein